MVNGARRRRVDGRGRRARRGRSDPFDDDDDIGEEELGERFELAVDDVAGDDVAYGARRRRGGVASRSRAPRTYDRDDRSRYDRDDRSRYDRDDDDDDYDDDDMAMTRRRRGDGVRGDGMRGEQRAPYARRSPSRLRSRGAYVEGRLKKLEGRVRERVEDLNEQEEELARTRR